MYKVILVVAILMGAAFYFPQTRPVMVDTFAPVMNPVFTWQTKGELGRIVRELETLQREGGPLPTPGEWFQSWMARNFLGRARSDAWGTDYTMKVWRDSLGIVSNGPDLEIGTPDDVIISIMTPRQDRRR